MLCIDSGSFASTKDKSIELWIPHFDRAGSPGIRQEQSEQSKARNS